MRSSLAVVRSLGSKNIEVTAGETTNFATSFFSKYCHNKVVYPSPIKNKNDFKEFLLTLVKKHNYALIIPVADDVLEPIMEIEDELSRCTRIAIPSKDIFMKCYDKYNTLKIAEKNNIPCPKTYLINEIEDVLELKNILSYPVVIKPRISSGRRGVKICMSAENLLADYVLVQKEYAYPLIQEYIPYGGELGVYTLFNFASKPRAFSVQRRIRSYPIAGGPSTLRETIKNDDSKKAMSLAFNLLHSMNWTGVAMVEFRKDLRDGSLKLMEVNPRFWGSLQLSILAGIDFPYLLYKMFTDGDVEPITDYKAGIKCRWLLPGDLLWFASTPNKLKNFKEIIRFDVPDDILSLNDFGPTLGFFSATIRFLFDKEMWKFIIR
jgi:predicted ATP-grasp superfamily ATP-dependent carboligase